MSSSSWTPNTSITQGDGNKEDNLYDTIVIGASLTAIIIVLVLLRFIINIVIDIVILRDVDAARTKCNNVSSRFSTCLSRCCCCGYCHRHRIQPVVPSQDTNHTATDIHSDVDDLEAHDVDDDDSSYSSHDRHTPTVELSFSLPHHHHHHHHHNYNHDEDEDPRSADTRTHVDPMGDIRCRATTPPSDPEIMLLQSMDTLLPSTIVTNEWIISIMSHLIHPTTNGMTTNIATTTNHSKIITTETTAAIPDDDDDDDNDVTKLESGLEVVSLSDTKKHDVVPKEQQSAMVPMNDNNENNRPLPYPYSGDVEDAVSTLPTCSICLQEFIVGQTISTVETCQHYFHTSCLHEWILQPVVIQQPNQNQHRRRRGLEQPSEPSPSHPLAPVRRLLLQSTRRNNHCPNCRTPIIVPESKLEDVLHSVFTRQQQQQKQHHQEER